MHGMAGRTRRVGVIGYEGVQGLDLNGPLDAFCSANLVVKRSSPPYELFVLGVKRGPLHAESGACFLPSLTLENAPALDTLIIPGGRGMRENAQTRSRVVRFLRHNHQRIRRIASVCTGIYALAESGLLDGCNATTHWRFADDAIKRFPKISFDADAIFIKHGRFYTSAGITAGIDLSLALIEEDLGNEVALAVARDLVVYLKRSGGQLQYSEPLRKQTSAHSDFSEIVAWMLDNLSSDLSVETLAERMSLSTRHFNRKFKSVFGATPADFVETLRLDEARWLLANNDVAIEHLATSVGYSGGDVFRRAFERRFGVVPSEYRARFC